MTETRSTKGPGGGKSLQYEPFSTSRSIRVLNFDQTKALICSLREVSLESQAESDKYVALSYAWGSWDAMRQLSCNGSEVEISQNLYDAVCVLRNFDSTANYWIDFICINQQDLDEKNRQVSLMREIYSRSTSTIIWLGNASDLSRLAFDLVKRLGSSFDAVRQVLGAGESGGVEKLARLRESLDLPAPDSQDIQALDGLLGSAWFTRTWCFQEAILPPTAHLVCGSLTTPWSDIRQACMVLEYFGQLGSIQNRWQLEHITLMGKLSDTIHNSPNPFHPHRSLIHLLPMVDTREASNARDKVYSYLGLVTEGLNEALQPDYRKTVEDVYTDVARYLLLTDEARGRFRASLHYEGKGKHPILIQLEYLETSRHAQIMSLSHDIGITEDAMDFSHVKMMPLTGLDILNCIYGMNKQTDLPTWVPDWRLPTKLSLCGISSDGRPRVYAGGLISAAVIPSPINDRLIGIFGISCDTIVHLSDALLVSKTDPFKSDRVSFQQLARPDGSWRTTALEASSTNKYTITGQDFSEAYLETLLAGFTPYSPFYDQDIKMVAWPATMQQASNQSPSQSSAIADAIQAERTKNISTTCTRRRLCVSQRGYMGLAPQESQIGDQIVIFFGGSTPFILRQAASVRAEHEQEQGAQGDVYELVGETYIHGLMHGEELMIGAGLHPPSYQGQYLADRDLERIPEDQIPSILNGTGKHSTLYVDPEELGLPSRVFWLR